MRLLNDFNGAKPQHWADATICLGFTLLGSLLPLYGGALLVRLFNCWDSWLAFLRHGEFAIYSAAILAPTLYILHGSPKHQRSFSILLYIGLAVSTILFAGVASKDLIMKANINIDEQFLFNFTWPLFIISVVLFFLATVLENARLQPDIEYLREQDIHDLETSFDKLKGN